MGDDEGQKAPGSQRTGDECAAGGELPTATFSAVPSLITHFGAFEILEKLGEGGMGVVYKARDTRLDRFVALKVLCVRTMSSPERLLRFVQEAKSASALNHPNIVTVHDIDTSGEFPFIAMEYVDGKTLD